MVFVWLALLSLGLVWAGLGQADSDRKLTTFDEINVQRINVVEPDGKPRVIVASRARAAGLYWEGKEHKHPSRSNGGFWFMNDDGDEVGGLTFGSGRLGEQYGASTRLTFDQYKQDETVSLAYQDSNGQRRVGLQVWDRSDKSMGPLIPLVDRLARATSDEERRQVRQEMAQMEEGYRSGYGERFFAGKMLGDSLVRLADKQGRPRLLLRVDSAGSASIEFLDEAGKVVRRIPGKASAP